MQPRRRPQLSKIAHFFTPMSGQTGAPYTGRSALHPPPEKPPLAAVNASPSVPVISAAGTPFGLQSVCHTLASANAHLDRFAWLGDGLAIALWTRDTKEDETVYERPGHHTLSCIWMAAIAPSARKCRAAMARRRGCARCPAITNRAGGCAATCTSCTCISCPSISRDAPCELDREPRELTLADRTYFEDPRIASLCQSLVNEEWRSPDGLLRTNETAHEVLSLLLRGQGVRRANVALKGGLSAATRRRLRLYRQSSRAAVDAR